MAQENSSSPRASNPLLLLVYWTVVGLPLCWGVYKTVEKSVPLFKSTNAQAATAPAAASPSPTATAAP